MPYALCLVPCALCLCSESSFLLIRLQGKRREYRDRTISICPVCCAHVQGNASCCWIIQETPIRRFSSPFIRRSRWRRSKRLSRFLQNLSSLLPLLRRWAKVTGSNR